MAYLAVIASTHVNGVAAIHSGERRWPQFYDFVFVIA
jgi:glucan phosphorylase